MSSWLTLALALSAFQTADVAAARTDDGDEPIVDTENGKVQGYRYSVPELGGITGSAFLGIPFAEPPVGSRRFRRPEQLRRPWTGIRFATRPPSSCFQVVMVSLTITKTKTSCLRGVEVLVSCNCNCN